MTLAAASLLASFAHAAAGYDTVTCKPGQSTNGLAIKSLVLEISKEDPEARMTVTYLHNTRRNVSSMAYEGSDFDGYTFMPNSNRDGDISVRLVRKQRTSWTANVSHGVIDTFSILDCVQK
jgi:hypothetical protein